MLFAEGGAAASAEAERKGFNNNHCIKSMHESSAEPTC